MRKPTLFDQMNSHDDLQLEREINRELKALPELSAPATMANRVMAVIERRLTVPWYRRSWETWPGALRLSSLAAMLMLFIGLCLGGWGFFRTETAMQAAHWIGHWFSGLSMIVNLFNTLAGSAVLVLKQLGTTFIVACLILAGLGYALFMGYWEPSISVWPGQNANQLNSLSTYENHKENAFTVLRSFLLPDQQPAADLIGHGTGN